MSGATHNRTGHVECASLLWNNYLRGFFAIKLEFELWNKDTVIAVIIFKNDFDGHTFFQMIFFLIKAVICS
ncbi:hypothetical protein D3C78_1909960 [compost metagenome]